MITCDTNILFPALEASHRDHVAARKFLEAKSEDEKFCLCELVLMEVYTLLRSPVTSGSPLSGAEATRKIENLRENPAWGLLDYPGTLMNKIWKEAARIEAYRQIYDVRLAFTLRHYGVREFATANTKDFKNFGFERVWNPLKEG